jgi:hypothetical protein
MREKVWASGRKPWIFSAHTNKPSIKGIEAAGYRVRYVLIRQRLLGWQQITRKERAVAELPVEETHVRVSRVG